jgi:hypothetical protein
MRDGAFREIEHGVDVDGEGVLPFLVGDLANLLERILVGGIVDQDVTRPNASTAFATIARQWLGSAMSPGHEYALRPALSTGRFGILRVFLLVE